MFDISEQKIAQLVSGCGWLSFFNIYHLFLQVNDGIILKLKVFVPIPYDTMDRVEDWDEKLKVRVTLDNKEPELYFS